MEPRAALMRPAKWLVVVGIVLAAGMASGAVLGVYGTIVGTVNLEEPVFYPNETGGLNINMAGSGSYTVSANSYHQFNHTLESTKTFYPMEARVFLKSKVDPDAVSWDYGNGTYFACTTNSTISYWDCPPTNSSIDATTFSLKLSAGADDLSLGLGTSTRVEVVEQ